jgi:DNA-nicking Smr family endonuclease
VHRPLSAEERALWAKVIETVRPLRPAQPAAPAPPDPAEPVAAPPASPKPKPAPARPRTAAPKPKPQPGETLDGTWDRRLSRGLVAPDLSVDLHGHNLATAYDLLDRKLDQAIAMEVRLLLLITGKPPVGEPPIARGRIRACRRRLARRLAPCRCDRRRPRCPSAARRRRRPLHRPSPPPLTARSANLVLSPRR